MINHFIGKGKGNCDCLWLVEGGSHIKQKPQSIQCGPRWMQRLVSLPVGPSPRSSLAGGTGRYFSCFVCFQVVLSILGWFLLDPQFLTISLHFLPTNWCLASYHFTLRISFVSFVHFSHSLTPIYLASYQPYLVVLIINHHIYTVTLH